MREIKMSKHKVPKSAEIPGERKKGQVPGYIIRVNQGVKGALDNAGQGSEDGANFPAPAQEDRTGGACGSSPWASKP
jgi:hypothetical protein